MQTQLKRPLHKLKKERIEMLRQPQHDKLDSFQKRQFTEGYRGYAKILHTSGFLCY